MILLEEILKTKKPSSRIPLWFMRQAGRYLPEYRALRSNYPDFLSFCRDSQGASEATLQPLHRFDVDAAIIFSDILVVPAALGQDVSFRVGEGPCLEPITTSQDLQSLSRHPSLWQNRLQPTLDALKLTRAALSPEKALIGFAGAPWTLACYMVEGNGSKTFEAARKVMARDPALFQSLMDLLTEITTAYLIWQIDSGAQVVKIFDSWAGHCPAWMRSKALVNPIKIIVQRIRAVHPHTPFLYFPKGVGVECIDMAQAVGCDGVALDQFVDPVAVRAAYDRSQASFVLQGGLDPLVMMAGGEALKQQVRHYLDVFQGLPYIFNLGHGMIPEMPIEHVTQTIEAVREWETKRFQEEGASFEPSQVSAVK